jgi:hypothetical protein
MTRFLLFCAALALSAAAIPAAAQPAPMAETPPPPALPPSEPAETPEPEPEPPLPPVESERKLALHGYLSQAFAVSDGHQVLGIPKQGTFDYRTAALQLRATLSRKDSFVIQLTQERLGESPVTSDRNNIELDWIFYERQFGASTSLRVGRVRVPFGIYNEIRFVGALLPFYRTPEVFYPVGGYAFSSVDGGLVSRSFFEGRPFSLDADVYGGEWSFLQVAGAPPVTVKNGFGGQLWLRTPVQGLRFGLGGNRSTWHHAIDQPPGARVPHDRWVASVDGNFDRIRASAELERDSFADVVVEATYLQVSLRATDRLSVNLQASTSQLHLALAQFDEELAREFAAGLGYAIRPDLVVKVEHHWATSRRFEVPGATVFDAPRKANFAIVSLSALF